MGCSDSIVIVSLVCIDGYYHGVEAGGKLDLNGSNSGPQELPV